MVTKIEVLGAYNERNNTNYETITALGKALTEHALRTTLYEMRKREAVLIAENEELE